MFLSLLGNVWFDFWRCIKILLNHLCQVTEKNLKFLQTSIIECIKIQKFWTSFYHESLKVPGEWDKYVQWCKM